MRANTVSLMRMCSCHWKTNDNGPEIRCRATQCGLKDARACARTRVGYYVSLTSPFPKHLYICISSSCVCLNLLIRHARVHTRTLQRKFSHTQSAGRGVHSEIRRGYTLRDCSLSRIKIIARHFLYRPPKSGRAKCPTCLNVSADPELL